MLGLKIFALKNKIKIIFYKNWNKVNFSLHNITIGKNSNIFNHLYLRIGNNSQITIGENFTFTSGDCINALGRNICGSIVTNPNSLLYIGNNVGISSSCIRVYNSITIKDNVKIGGDCILLDSNSHSLNYQDRINNKQDQENTLNAPIIIESDVLIGARSIILKGVTIGARSIIGAGSIVTKSIPEDCIAAGNPCKIIKYINGK